MRFKNDDIEVQCTPTRSAAILSGRPERTSTTQLADEDRR
jgi:hypothetical protein